MAAARAGTRPVVVLNLTAPALGCLCHLFPFAWEVLQCTADPTAAMPELSALEEVPELLERIRVLEEIAVIATFQQKLHMLQAGNPVWYLHSAYIDVLRLYKPSKHKGKQAAQAKEKAHRKALQLLEAEQKAHKECKVLTTPLLTST
eukprot:scaffold11977_cov21-Tisochrysis_lutea.AAC.1